MTGKQVAPQAASAAILSEDSWHPPRGSTASPGASVVREHSPGRQPQPGPRFTASKNQACCEPLLTAPCFSGENAVLFDAYADLFSLLETIFFFHKCIQIFQVKSMACLIRDHQYYTHIIPCQNCRTSLLESYCLQSGCLFCSQVSTISQPRLSNLPRQRESCRTLAVGKGLPGNLPRLGKHLLPRCALTYF